MSLTLSQLASHAARVLEEGSPRQALAYAWPHPWAGGESIEVAGRTLPLRYCQSSLEVREALAAEGETPAVLLVGLPENALGQDILGRLARHRLLHVDRWQLVQDAYGVRQVDPRLFPMQWLPAVLMDAVAARPKATSPVLTLEDAMGTCLAFLFGLPAEQPALDDLARTCEDNHARWLAISPDHREHYRQHLVEQFGPLAEAFVAAMENGNGHAVTAIGLACDVLYADEAEKLPELRDARVRLESRLGGHRLKVADGKSWARLARDLAARLPEAGRLAAERKASELLQAIGASDHLELSGVLSLGLDARLDQLGESIERFLRTPDALVEVEVAAACVSAHRLAQGDHPGPAAARMAARLCRSLAVGAAGTAVNDFVAHYLEHGAWQDWARRTLRGVRPERFARAVTKLLDQVAVARRAQDEAFASSLLATLRLGEAPGRLTPVESALDQVVAPLASQSPVLLVVLDGMSADVSLAISQSLLSRGWGAWARRGEPLALLATVPSVTECSRSSLLSGRLVRGVARQEAQAFAAHEGLRRASRSGQPPRLFHKAGLEQSHQLGTEVAAAIADTGCQVVAVVINAIDDALAKSDQIRIDWDIDTIPLLAEVLDQASRAGRAVVLTSDHGHVLERDSTLLPGGSGERYRMAATPAGEGELLADGPRVRALMESAIVVPWREDFRYAMKKNGYHGGVSRQEMIVPLGIWTPPGMELPDAGYLPSNLASPGWWEADGQVPPPRSVPQPPARRRPAEASGDLFAPRQASGLADALLASSVFGHQQARVGRVALEPQRLATLVRKLEDGGGRARIEQLAQAIEMPAVRMRGVVSILQRTLNIDGFPVVTFEQATGTVLLDLPLLRTQFQL